MANATAEFLKTLQDPSKYTARLGVPVFKPHERVLPEFKAPDGKTYPEIVIRVTAKDLPDIAYETNRAGPQPMTEGHRIPDPNFPEKLQPRKVGWEINHRPGTFSPDGVRTEPCILADLYYETPLFEEVGPNRYPFRSVDYDRVEKRLAGTALLVRRPFLDLGMIPYGGDDHHRRVVPYTFDPHEAHMPAEEDKFTPEEEAQYAKLCRYMAKKHPRLASYMEAGPTNTMPPAPQPYAAPAGATVSYADLEKRLATESCERLLDKVVGVKFDRAKELTVMMGLPAESRPAHVQYMLDNYQKLPGAGNAVDVNRTAPGATGTQPTAPSGEKVMTRPQMDAAVGYSAQNNVPWGTARVWAMANIPAGN